MDDFANDRQSTANKNRWLRDSSGLHGSIKHRNDIQSASWHTFSCYCDDPSCEGVDDAPRTISGAPTIGGICIHQRSQRSPASFNFG
jgi:hypothetical protein